MFQEDEEPTIKSTSKAAGLRDRLSILQFRRRYRIEDLKKAEDTEQLEETALAAAAATRAAMASITDTDSDPPPGKLSAKKIAKVLAALVTLGAAAKESIDFLKNLIP